MILANGEGHEHLLGRRTAPNSHQEKTHRQPSCCLRRAELGMRQSALRGRYRVTVENRLYRFRRVTAVAIPRDSAFSRALHGWSVFSRAHKCMWNRLSAPWSSGGWDRTSLVTGQLCNGCILVGPPDGSLSSPHSFPQAIFQSASPTLPGFTGIHLNTAAASL